MNLAISYRRINNGFKRLALEPGTVFFCPKPFLYFTVYTSISAKWEDAAFPSTMVRRR